MGLLDQIGDTAQAIGEGGLGLLGTVGEIYFAAKSPAGYAAMKKDGERKRLKAERESYVQGLLGMQQGTPDENLAPDAFNMEEAQAMQNLDPQRNYFQQGQAPATQAQTAAYMMGSEYPGQQKAGADLFADTFDKEKQQDTYSHFTHGAGGNTFAFNRDTNSMEQLPGAVIPQKEQQEIVRVVNNIGSTMKPESGTYIKDGVQVPIPGSSKDTGSDLYREERSKLYRKAIKPLNSALTSVTNFQNIYKETGSAPSEFSAAGKILKQAQTTALMDLKNVFELGVLSKDDERLINNILPSGTSVIDYALYPPGIIGALIERTRSDILSRGGEIRSEYPNANYGNDRFKPVEAGVIDWNDLK